MATFPFSGIPAPPPQPLSTMATTAITEELNLARICRARSSSLARHFRKMFRDAEADNDEFQQDAQVNDHGKEQGGSDDDQHQKAESTALPESRSDQHQGQQPSECDPEHVEHF